MPPQENPRQEKGQQINGGAGGVEVDVAVYSARREQASADHDPDKGLHEFALMVHARIAGAHETPELRILPVERLLDLLQLALLVFRERHDASHKNPCARHVFGDLSPHTRFNFQNTSVDTPLGRVHPPAGQKASSAGPSVSSPRAARRTALAPNRLALSSTACAPSTHPACGRS